VIVYRLCHPDYAHDLSGTGASLNGARWNPRGLPVLYTSASSSLAILEFLVHIRGVKGNMSYKLLSIDTGDAAIETLGTLPDNWMNDESFTRKVGEEWLLSKRSVGLQIPSVHNPLEKNVLLNPRHAVFNPRITRSDYYWFDGRLMKVK